MQPAYFTDISSEGQSSKRAPVAKLNLSESNLTNLVYYQSFTQRAVMLTKDDKG